MCNKVIEFRAWEKTLKEMIPVHDISFEREIINTDSAWRTFDEVDLEWFTNLLDKNKKRIFEGDIVRAINTGNIGEIKYVSEHGAFVVRSKDKTGQYYEYLDLGLCLNFFEVIGNIHENPELLEAK